MCVYTRACAITFLPSYIFPRDIQQARVIHLEINGELIIRRSDDDDSRATGNAHSTDPVATFDQQYRPVRQKVRREVDNFFSKETSLYGRKSLGIVVSYGARAASARGIKRAERRRLLEHNTLRCTNADGFFEPSYISSIPGRSNDRYTAGNLESGGSRVARDLKFKWRRNERA